MSKTKILRGSCHCGRVQFEVDADPTSLSQCNCSMCSRKGAIDQRMTEIGAVRILQGDNWLSTYQFNTLQAKHYFCKICGITRFTDLGSIQTDGVSMLVALKILRSQNTR